MPEMVERQAATELSQGRQASVEACHWWQGNGARDRQDQPPRKLFIKREIVNRPAPERCLFKRLRADDGADRLTTVNILADQIKTGGNRLAFKDLCEAKLAKQALPNPGQEFRGA